MIMSELYGSMVFNDKVMAKYLPEESLKDARQTICRFHWKLQT